MEKRILVTGGSGFIGTNLVDYYIKQRETVLNLDRLAPVVASAKPYWKQADLLDKEEVLRTVQDFDPTHVVHLAARTDLDGRDAAGYAVNTVGTLNLMEALGTCAELKKAIFASSMLVCAPGYIPAHDLDFAAATVYGESKANMERLIRQQHFTAEWIIVRPTSIWGPWFKTPYRDFFDRVMAGSMYNIKGNSCSKTYGFVLNTVYQLDKLLDAGGINGSVFYLGDLPYININEWANHIADTLQEKRPAEIPYPVFTVAAKLGDVLNKMGLEFPMTSFRLKNMTTDNVLPLQKLYDLTGPTPYSEATAISITLGWINNNK